MIERMKHLLPNDRMKIIQLEAFYTDANSVLTLLYQPLIGIKPIALFLFFENEAKNQAIDASYSHHHAMTMLDMSLDEFYEARKRLEAIGLLKTHKETGSFTTFYYMMKRPLSAQDFFDDSIFSVLLEHQVGKDVSQRLKKKLTQTTKVPSNLENVTVSFDDVFTTVQPTDLPQNNQPEEPSEEQTNLPVDWLHKILTQQQVQSNFILTDANLTFMGKMSKIYDVNYLELEKALIWAVSEDSTFDRKEFHAMCKDIYYRKHGTVPPRLYRQDGKPPAETKPSSNESNENLSKEQQLIQHFEKITHRELLEDQSSSGTASMKEVDMIAEMMEEHGLEQPVMNVLVDYVLKRNQNKLAKNYLETIAAHWSRENIKTAEQAMQIAKREHHMYQKWSAKNKQKQTSRKKSTEVVPKWFKEQKESKSQQPEKPKKSADEIEKDRKELEQFIKSFQK